jgi:hypothetical protein
MKSRVIVLMSMVFVLTACMVAPAPGGGLQIIPILPEIVELDMDVAEPYYQHNGYHYFYTNQRWFYSSERNGHRTELPKSHWPRETRRRGGDRH